jgi:hypothetical protein
MNRGRVEEERGGRKKDRCPLTLPTQDLKRFNTQHHTTFRNIVESTAKNGLCNLHLPWSKTTRRLSIVVSLYRL